MRVAQWKYAAIVAGGVILSLLSFFSVSYIGKVEALEEKVAKDQTLLEKIDEDVTWLKNHWGER